MGYQGNKVLILAAETANAEACRGKDADYILYSPGWVSLFSGQIPDGVRQSVFTIVVAHELGHIVLGHDILAAGSNFEVEKAADRYAGAVSAD